MKTHPHSRSVRLWIVVPLLACAALLVLVPRARSQETATNAIPKAAAPPKAANSAAAPKKPVHQLTGAELYSIHCNRCHPERYPTERTAAQWKTILLHMRVRANLPAGQARIILKYLQDNSGR